MEKEVEEGRQREGGREGKKKCRQMDTEVENTQAEKGNKTGNFINFGGLLGVGKWLTLSDACQPG